MREPQLFVMINTSASAKYTAGALASFFRHTEFSARDVFVLIDNDNDYPEYELSSYPEVNILCTTITKTSADIVKKSFPDRVIHQYTPIDVGVCVKRFLDNWQPDYVMFVDSELWPNLITMSRQYAEKMIQNIKFCGCG